MKIPAKHIQEWSIVSLADGRIGVLSHHWRRGYNIVLIGGSGVEIKNTDELECIATAAISMQNLLSFKSNVVKIIEDYFEKPMPDNLDQLEKIYHTYDLVGILNLAAAQLLRAVDTASPSENGEVLQKDERMN